MAHGLLVKGNVSKPPQPSVAFGFLPKAYRGAFPGFVETVSIICGIIPPALSKRKWMNDSNANRLIGSRRNGHKKKKRKKKLNK